jgi:hypothetical protein
MIPYPNRVFSPSNTHANPGFSFKTLTLYGVSYCRHASQVPASGRLARQYVLNPPYLCDTHLLNPLIRSPPRAPPLWRTSCGPARRWSAPATAPTGPPQSWCAALLPCLQHNPTTHCNPTTHYNPYNITLLLTITPNITLLLTITP